MKYWTSSRVGAVPQPGPPSSSSSKRKERNARFHRKKGITMEDLKKQTAARLAHEQKQHNNPQYRGPKSSGSGGGGEALSGDATNHSHRASSNADSTLTSPGGLHPSDGPSGGRPHARVVVVDAGGRENVHPSPSSFPAPESSSGAPEESLPLQPMVTDPYLLPYESQRLSSLEAHNGSASATSSSSSPYPIKLGTNLSTHSSSSLDSAAARPQPAPPAPTQQQQRKKSKLPHGLTVQELKEMTKARLQAEAAAEQKGLSVLSVPPTPLGGGGFRDDGVSPLPPPPAFNSTSRPRPHSQARDAWSYDSRSDAWETGSVSTVASEYLGSESAYGLGSFGPEEPSPSPYGGRPPIMGVGGPIRNFTDAPPMEGVLFPGASPGYHPQQLDVGGGAPPLQLRRRAATLSPRQGLSFLDERHEVYPDHDTMPTLPSFGSPSALHYPSRSRHHSYGAGADRFHPVSGLRAPLQGPSTMELNRPRTSSAASLPPMSHTADEFAAILVEPPSPAAPARFASSGLGLGTFRDQAPSPTVTGLADSFHQDGGAPNSSFLGGPSVPPPPGLTIDPYSSSGIGTPAMDLRARASTWGGGTSSLDSVFGPGLFGGAVASDRQPNHQHDSQLCDDLASILKLSVPDHLPPPQQQRPLSLSYDAHITSRGDNQLFPPPPGM